MGDIIGVETTGAIFEEATGVGIICGALEVIDLGCNVVEDVGTTTGGIEVDDDTTALVFAAVVVIVTVLSHATTPRILNA